MLHWIYAGEASYAGLLFPLESKPRVDDWPPTKWPRSLEIAAAASRWDWFLQPLRVTFIPVRHIAPLSECRGTILRPERSSRIASIRKPSTTRACYKNHRISIVYQSLFHPNPTRIKCYIVGRVTRREATREEHRSSSSARQRSALGPDILGYQNPRCRCRCTSTLNLQWHLLWIFLSCLWLS